MKNLTYQQNLLSEFLVGNSGAGELEYSTSFRLGCRLVNINTGVVEVGEGGPFGLDVHYRVVSVFKH